MSEHSRHAHVPVLDGIRGLAILAVLIYHWFPYESYNWLTSRFSYITRLGWVGVELFFTLSGFLITGLLLRARSKPNYFRNFYARRTLRILPLYFTTLAFVFLLFPLVAGPSGLLGLLERKAPELIKEYRYLQDRQWVLWTYLSNVPGLVEPPPRWLYFLSHFWSLAVEEHFYLFWPVIVLLVGERRLPAICLAVVILSLCVRTVVAAGFHALFACYVFTPLRLDGLVLGALLAVFAERDPSLSGIWPALRILATGSGLALVLGWSFQSTLEPSTLFNCSVGFTLLAVTCVGCLAAALRFKPGSGPNRILVSRFLGFFGKYSYAMYVFDRLLHYPLKLAVPIPKLTAALGSELLASILHAAMGIGLTALVALASWHLLEKHFLKLKYRFE